MKIFLLFSLPKIGLKRDRAIEYIEPSSAEVRTFIRKKKVEKNAKNIYFRYK